MTAPSLRPRPDPRRHGLHASRRIRTPGRDHAAGPSRPDLRPDRCDRPGDDDDHLRDGRPHPQGRVSGRARPHRRPRAGRRDPRARLGRRRLRSRRPRAGRRHHALRQLLLLPARRRRAVLRTRGRVGDDRRLAARQLRRRRAGRLLPRPVRAGQPGQDPRRPQRRGARPAGRYRVHRHLGCGDRERPDRPDRRRLRPVPIGLAPQPARGSRAPR